MQTVDVRPTRQGRGMTVVSICAAGLVAGQHVNRRAGTRRIDVVRGIRMVVRLEVAGTCTMAVST